MRFSKGVSNEIDVETIAANVMMILWIEATNHITFLIKFDYCISSAISRAIFTQIKAKVQWNLSPRGGLSL